VTVALELAQRRNLASLDKNLRGAGDELGLPVLGDKLPE